jgi:hypothetical protein
MITFKRYCSAHHSIARQVSILNGSACQTKSMVWIDSNYNYNCLHNFSGSMLEWVNILTELFAFDPECRVWFTNNILYENLERTQGATQLFKVCMDHLDRLKITENVRIQFLIIFKCVNRLHFIVEIDFIFRNRSSTRK